MAFLKKNHMLVAVLLFGSAAVLYLGYPTGSVAPLLAGVLVEGVAWITLLDGGSSEGAGKEKRTH